LSGAILVSALGKTHIRDLSVTSSTFYHYVIEPHGYGPKSVADPEILKGKGAENITSASSPFIANTYNFYTGKGGLLRKKI